VDEKSDGPGTYSAINKACGNDPVCQDRATQAAHRQATAAKMAKTGEDFVVDQAPGILLSVGGGKLIEKFAEPIKRFSKKISDSVKSLKFFKKVPKKLASINRRHHLNSTSIANSKKTAPGTFAPKELLDKDISSFNNGKFIKIKNGDVLINGRRYGIKNEGATLFPRSGGAPEFVDLTRAQIKAIQIIKKVPADKLDTVIKNAKLSSNDLNFAKQFIKDF
jgi:hypothetical protein